MACDSLLLPHLLVKKNAEDPDIATNDSLLLPHLLMKKNKEDQDIATRDFPCPPHRLVKKKLVFEKKLFQGPCSLRLWGNLFPISSPSNEKPTLYYDFLFHDNTKVILPSKFGTDRYFFPCPFDDDGLSIHDIHIEPFRFVRSVIPVDILMEHRHREYFELEMTRFIHDKIKEAGDKFHVNVYITASIQRKIWHEETVEIAKRIEEESRSTEKEEGTRSTTNGRDCAVCFEEVEMSRFKGMELDCYHVFHVSCIAPWLAQNITCPMCRCVQIPHVKLKKKDIS